MGLETTRLEASEHAPGVGSVNVDALTGTVHFIGIGGIGMSALARLLLARGKQVSGSDKEENAITKELAGLGARTFVGHDAKNLDGAPVSLVVVSTAITDANPELAAARGRGLPVMHRSDMLRALTERRKLLAVSGTHGKTTTTGMLAQVFIDAELEPEVVVGGIFPRIGSNSYAGKGEYFIAEADESDRTHAKMHSWISMITNIETDHLENYPGGMAEICDNMVAFANGSSQACVVCVDDAGCVSILPRLKVPVVSYGARAVSPNADYVYELVGESGAFVVSRRGEKLGEVRMSVPGEHNKLNALGVLAVAMESGVPFEKAAKSLESFGGVDRRFTKIGTKGGITVVDDYGHHPTEVRATLHAAQEYARTNGMKRVVAVFQPHQPGRLRDLWNEFCDSFAGADLVLLADVYIARGAAIEGINSERFAKEVRCSGAVEYVGGPVAELAERIAPKLQPGDLVLTIGAGDITKVGPELIKRL